MFLWCGPAKNVLAGIILAVYNPARILASKGSSAAECQASSISESLTTVPPFNRRSSFMRTTNRLFLTLSVLVIQKRTIPRIFQSMTWFLLAGPLFVVSGQQPASSIDRDRGSTMLRIIKGISKATIMILLTMAWTWKLDSKPPMKE